ncbi:MAG TPA: hypothetical protein DCL21_02195 [Alphaproteobacteria bacterium]|nr:hypothetical protein [Alphaproteobacteria bacterium]
MKKNESILPEIMRLEKHLRTEFHLDNMVEITKDNNHVIFPVKKQNVVFDNAKKSLTVMFEFLIGLNSTENKQEHPETYRFIELLSSVYFLNYILKDLNTQNKSEFFEKYNTMPDDELSFACLIAYMLMNIEDKLSENSELYVTFTKKHGYLANELVILAKLVRLQLNGFIETAPAYGYKYEAIEACDMLNGSWRNNRFVHLLIYGAPLERQSISPLNKSLASLGLIKEPA